MSNMLNTTKIIFLITSLSLSINVLHAQSNVNQTLSTAEQLFDRGDYEKSSSTLEKLGSEKSIESSIEKWPATESERYFLLKARLSYAFGHNADVKKWLRRLYDQNSNTKLDPLKDPPQSHEIWTSFAEEDSKEADSTDVKPETKPETKATENLSDQFKSLDDKLRQKSRFWIGLAPFGIGHFDAGYKYSKSGLFYLFTELGLLVFASEVTKHERNIIRDNTPELVRGDGSDAYDEAAELHSEIGSTFAFLGLWGHELNSMTPLLYERDPEKTQWTRYFLSFFPFGVGQSKNNEHTKALGIVIAETTFLALAISSASKPNRDAAMNLFWITVGYGAYDGWANHKWTYDPKQVSSSYDFNITPIVMRDHNNDRLRWGGAVSVSYYLN